MNNKDEVILKSTRVFKTKNDGSTAKYFKNEVNGTTLECLVALASMVVAVENEQPEEYKAKFRANFMEYLNKMRSRQV